MYRLAESGILPQRAACLVPGICLVFSTLTLFHLKTDAADILRTYTVPRLVAYEFTLRNEGAGLLERSEFRTYAPVLQTGNQRCDRVAASHPFDLFIDGVGNRVMSFKLKRLPPFATRIIRITADLRLSDKANPVGPTETSLWLKPERYIESDNPLIRQTARKLTSSDRLQTAQNIFQWVAGHIRYAGYLSNERGALYAYSHRSGDCTEYMYLFIALCRASGIPARGVAGYICPENKVLKAAGFHNWAEFYQAGTWYIADPQNRVFMTETRDYIAMHIMGSEEDGFDRFAFRGAALRVYMN